VRGVEDLGDGLSAGFWLESGTAPDTGAQIDAARFWNRRSTVSLMGPWGELRAGRDFTPVYLGFSNYDAFGTSGIATSDKFALTFGATVDTNVRSDNMVQYFTPNTLGGFYGRVAVAPGEGVTGRKYSGLRAGYANQQLDVSASYGQTRTAAAPTGDQEYKVAVVGASYDFGLVKATGFVSQYKFGNGKLAVAHLGALIPVGLGQIRASYMSANASGKTVAGTVVDPDDATQLALGYLYNLSKRTAVYATAARIDNKGRAAFALQSTPALPSPNTQGKDSRGFEVGMRHAF